MRETIEIKLYGFDESGADGVPPNPWWARTSYATIHGEVTITSSRRPTAWRAIADVIHAMNPECSKEPYAVCREINDGVTRWQHGQSAGDGRYVPSPKVCYSKHGGKTEMARRKSGAVEGLLRELQDVIGAAAEAADEPVLRRKIAQAVDNYRAATRLHALDLPWREQKMGLASSEGGRDREIVSLSGHVIGRELTAKQSRAILHMAVVYTKAAALLEALRDDTGTMVIEAEAHEQAEALAEALALAGWVGE